MNTEFQAWPSLCGQENSRHFLNRSDAKLKSIITVQKVNKAFFYWVTKVIQDCTGVTLLRSVIIGSTSFFLSHSENVLFLQHQSERLCAYSLVHHLLWCPLPARIIGVSHMGTYTKANVFVTSDHTVMTKLFQLFPTQEHSSTCPFKWLQLYFHFRSTWVI